MEWIIGIVTGLIVSALSAGIAWFARGESYRKRVVAAPTKFVDNLDSLIRRAVAEGPEDARVNARAIVGMRNSLRQYTVAISQLLNSDIDVLQAQVTEEPILRPLIIRAELQNPSEQVSNRALYETIRVLERTWKSKRDEVETSIRQMLSLFGLDRV
jgi:hypothetical protein